MPNDVTSVHPEYRDAKDRWQLAEDAAKGESAVKAAKEKYLPKPNPQDTSLENDKRYENYVKRAVYYNATGRTLAGLIGLAFANDPEVEVPDTVEYAQTDLSGAGLTLLQHAQNSLAAVLKQGRCGLLVDYPALRAKTPTRADEASGDVRPTVTFYSASCVHNWGTSQRQGKTILSLVVLFENYEEEDSTGFGGTIKNQYRVLHLAGGTVYTVDIWRKVKNQGDEGEKWALVETGVPLQGNGQPWSTIPFQFIGAQNNDWTVDDAPLYDIASLNIAHYRNSADYEDSVYLCGQPQFWISGLDVEWRDHLEKTGIYVGSRTVLPLPQGGAAGVLQAQPNTLAKEAMDAKEKQMAALGARLIRDSSVQKTARQQASEDNVANSVLALCCGNVSSAYIQVLQWFANFAAVKGPTKFGIATDFASAELDAQMFTALTGAVQGLLLPMTDFWAAMRRAGFIAAGKTDDDIRNELEAQPPLGADLGVNPADAGASSEPPPNAAAA